MDEITSELARLKSEHKRLQRATQKERSRHNKQRDHAVLVGTIAFCHEPTSGSAITAAILRKYGRVLDEDVESLTLKIKNRFLATPVNTLAQWLDWSGDIPRSVRTETQRLVEDARLIRWIGEQNSDQGVAPPPQFVWEKRCSLSVDNNHREKRCSTTLRPARSAATKKWLQRFRKRWNLTLGRLPGKDILPTETMQNKVCMKSAR